MSILVGFRIVTVEKASHSCQRAGLFALTVDIMRRLLILLLFFALLSGLASARSSVGDWQSVQDIPAGWQITVVTEFTFPCIFAQASDQELICTPLQRAGTATERRDIHVRRDRIQEVRVERRDGTNMLAGAGGGGALGAVLGVVLVAGARGPAAFLFGLGGASLGARTGQGLHILHGKVIYRRSVPGKNANAAPAQNLAKGPIAQTSP